MLFGFHADKDTEQIDGLINGWNEIFKEPTRSLVSETKYYKSKTFGEGNYLISVKPMFPLSFWIMVLSLGIISSTIFGWWKIAVALSTILLVMSLFALPYMYILGTKFRLKKAGYLGKIKYINSKKIFRNVLDEVYDES